MDKDERRNIMRNKVEMHKGKHAEKLHEFATLSDYKEAMLGAYRKTKREQMKDEETTKDKLSRDL